MRVPQRLDYALRAIVLLALMLYLPPLRSLFSFATMAPWELLVAFGAAALSVTWFEMLKLYRRRKGGIA